MHHKRRTMFNRVAQVWCRCRVVDDQWNACASADFCQTVEVGDMPPGLAIVSQKDRARVVVDRRFDRAASSMSTKVADQPKRLIVWLNCVIVPP